MRLPFCTSNFKTLAKHDRPSSQQIQEKGRGLEVCHSAFYAVPVGCCCHGSDKPVPFLPWYPHDAGLGGWFNMDDVNGECTVYEPKHGNHGGCKKGNQSSLIKLYRCSSFNLQEMVGVVKSGHLVVLLGMLCSCELLVPSTCSISLLFLARQGSSSPFICKSSKCSPLGRSTTTSHHHHLSILSTNTKSKHQHCLTKHTSI